MAQSHYHSGNPNIPRPSLLASTEQSSAIHCPDFLWSNGALLRYRLNFDLNHRRKFPETSEPADYLFRLGISGLFVQLSFIGQETNSSDLYLNPSAKYPEDGFALAICEFRAY